ncbi:tyrosyl-DNA phosphodiesterase 2 [Elysia marginata]|uniref:Tyrosyl-DNA phosphodiesterase 2 n=1 Tax=Elysia marginata TaxID=1093978 RepID=A0AAV4G1S7_9GAST|nr:tyrosyl-DNA phosphodiesterase 2 [Elysia marginata]
MSLSKQHLQIYNRAPSAATSYATNEFFRNEFRDVVQTLRKKYTRFMIVGDLNFHIDVPSAPETKKFISLLNDFELQQKIHVPTHKDGHTLDLIITPLSDNYTKNITVIDKTISDHYLLSVDLNTQKPSKTKRTVTSRNLKMLEPSKFSTEFHKALKTLNNSTVSADCLDNTLRRTLDQLPPLQARTISQRPVSPWFSLCIKVAKQHRRRAERHWRKTRLTIHHHIIITHRHKVKTII